MEQWYPVYRNGEKVGELTVSRQGLYYSFLCRAKLPADSRCRLYACTQGSSRDLGLCVPSGNEFILRTRIPTKYFGPGEYSFCLDRAKAENFIPVSSNQPFPMIDRLHTGEFVIRGDTPGIVFTAREQR